MILLPSARGALGAHTVAAGVTWNPSDKGVNVSLSGGNLVATQIAGGGGTDALVRATTSHATGKYYIEWVRDVSTSSYPFVGCCNASVATTNSTGNGGSGVYNCTGNNFFCYFNGSNVNTGQTWAAADVMMMAVDLTALKIWFGRGGTWFNSGNPAAGTGSLATITSDTYFPFANLRQTSVQVTARFASASWGFSAPSGFGQW